MFLRTNGTYSSLARKRDNVTSHKLGVSTATTQSDASQFSITDKQHCYCLSNLVQVS